LPAPREIQAFLSVAPPLIQAYVPFKILTGFRQGQLLELRKDQFKSDGIHFTQTKGGKRRIMAWSEEMRAAVDAIKALPRPVTSMFLFCTRRGQPYTSDGFRSIWHRAMNKALTETDLRERFTEHDLRAVTGTLAQERGQDAQVLLGHTNPKTTEIYLRGKSPERIKPLK